MKTKTFLAVIITSLLSLNLAAQENERRFSVEVSGGPSFATREFADGLRMGFGFDGVIHYRFLPHTGIYAGWGENWFNAENAAQSTHLDYEETGYVLGLQYKRRMEGRFSSYFLRAGALYNHIEIENENGEITGDTGHGPGLQLAAGIELPLGSSWSLTPVVKYHALTRTLNSEGSSTNIRYNYLTVRIGIIKSF